MDTEGTIVRSMDIKGERVDFIATPHTVPGQGILGYTVHCTRTNGEHLSCFYKRMQSTEAIIQLKKEVEKRKDRELHPSKEPTSWQIMGKSGMTLSTEVAFTAQEALDNFAKNRGYQSWVIMSSTLALTREYNVENCFRINLRQQRPCLA